MAPKKGGRKSAKRSEAGGGTKKVKNTGLKASATGRMLRQGSGKKVSKLAVAEAIAQATAYVHKVANMTFPRLGKSKTLKVSKANDQRNLLREALQAMCCNLDIDAICSSRSIAKHERTQQTRDGKRSIVVRSTGVASIAAYRVFVSQHTDFRVGENSRQFLCNLIDAYILKLGETAAMLAGHAGRASIIKKDDVALAAHFIH